jgi:acetyl esterase/lipase
MKKLAYILIFSLLGSNAPATAQEFIPLWPEGKKPNSNGQVVKDSLYNERIWRVGTPGIYAFPVAKSENKGTSVLICPGGGYERLSHLYNGFNFARWFNTLGINAFVLIYRLPHQQDLRQRQVGPLQDAQRAMRLLRSNAARWNINPGKLGVMGVSAGGHVASTLGTQIGDVSSVRDSLDKVSYRPDFMILLSPVITMGSYTHPGSKKNFLGADTTKANIQRYSNELQVTSATPPAFIVHALNDSTVSVRNSLMFYDALLNNKVNASIHIFPQGGHGIKLVDNPGSTDLWLNLLELWMNESNFFAPGKK